MAESVTSDWRQSNLPFVLQDYSDGDIPEADQTSIFYIYLLHKFLSLKSEKCVEGKRAKERLTVMVSAIRSGTENAPFNHRQVYEAALPENHE